MYESIPNELRAMEAGSKRMERYKRGLLHRAARAIEDLNRQRDRAYARLCEWCGVCPEGKRNAEDCEIAALNPEPPKDGGPDA